MAIGLSAGTVRADDLPRFVSVNLCTDQMLMLLAEPEEIASISFLAIDPQVSAMSEKAQDFTLNHGQLEEIVQARPDLVLAHEWTSPILLAGLERFGIAYAQFSTPKNMDEIPAFITAFGQAIGREAKAAELVEDYSIELADIEARNAGADADLSLLTFGPNGWVNGTGNIAGEAMRMAGFDYLAEDYGLEFGGMMPLELLVTAEPDVIVTSSLYPGNSRSEALMGHSALRKIDAKIYSMNHDKAWACGLPQSLDGLRELVALHDEIGGEI